MACCHTMSNQYELLRAVGPPRHISGKVAALRQDRCSFEIHFNASPQHSHMAPFSGRPGNGLFCRDLGRGKRPCGPLLTIAARVEPLYALGLVFFPSTTTWKTLPLKPFVFNTQPALRLAGNCSSSAGCKFFSLRRRSLIQV